ncbi:cytochrome c oxidase assembly protein [Halobacillus naozhouensis]|uniref:Cytochrome c oxidase assembly protein n=1 Tax=Halobacillus naozhouensis TaxID=554880 RepID=A0ABY8IZ02_9BACI|nr:cytochrome c oxidase assembly protein [Halobacillus naozhouensis]WFT75463.1 cytochrome c oxidase assembly protein [Halobacillus naozhouensis]
MSSDYLHQGSGFLPDLITVLPFAMLLGLYIWAAITSSQRSRLKSWPLHRYVCWCVGLLCAGAAIAGPLANRAHDDFTAHMIAHLLLGMLAPLLLVLSAPVTLLLRTVPVRTAKAISRLLKSWPVSIVSHPVSASILNIGGLWILYTTSLYEAMHHNFWVGMAVHIHMFLAGYLFTAAIIYIDLTPHRYSFVYRAVVLILTLAGHSILSKYIYGQPPGGVPQDRGELGAMVMYYGGDVIDIFLIIMLCHQWYTAAHPRISFGVSQ